jgi:hypothetical protein
LILPLPVHGRRADTDLAHDCFASEGRRMSDDNGCSVEQRASLEPPGVYANQVFLNVIDGMVRISFGLKAGGYLKYTDAVTISPGLALALHELITTYVPPPAPAVVAPTRAEKPGAMARRDKTRTFRTTPH